MTPNQVTKLLIANIINVGILRLPNDMTSFTRQDAWISIILGGIYPFYIVLAALYLAKKHPKENILTLSKRYMGSILGTVVNLMFLLNFVFYITSACAGIGNFLRTYVISYMSSFRFLLAFVPLAAYTAHKGLKLLGRLSEITFYCIFFIGMIPILALAKGSYLNVMPVGGSGLLNILKGVRNSLYAYSGIEVILLIYPRINNVYMLKPAALKACIYTCLGYTWINFVTVYYLSTNIIKKTMWATLYTIEALRLPIINNFRFVVMFLWTAVTLISTAISYYSFELIISDAFKEFQRKKIYIFSIPLIILLPFLYGNEVKSRNIISIIAPISVVFNFIYVTVIALFARIRRDED